MFQSTMKKTFFTKELYGSPEARVCSLLPMYCLVASNTEHIDDDDDDLGWN